MISVKNYIDECILKIIYVKCAMAACNEFNIKYIAYIIIALFCVFQLSINGVAEAINREKILKESMHNHYLLSKKYQSNYNYEKAINEYNLLLADAFHVIANNYSFLNNYSKAKILYQKSIQLNPNDILAKIDYADAAIAARDFNTSISIANQLMLKNDYSDGEISNCEYRVYVAQILWLSGLRKEAIGQYKSIDELYPSYINDIVLAESYLAVNELKSAQYVFNNLLKKYGDSALLHRDIGRVYGFENYPNLAIPELKTALRENPNLLLTHYMLGNAILAKSPTTEFPAVISEMKKELNIDPNNNNCYYVLGLVYMQTGKYIEAIKSLNKSIAFKKNNPRAYLLLGKIYVDTGDDEKAIQAFKNAIYYTDNMSYNHFEVKGAYYQLGHLLIKHGDVSLGKKYIKIASNFMIVNKLQEEINMNGSGLNYLKYIDTDGIGNISDGQKSKVIQYNQSLSLIVADAYNNIGVIMAAGDDYNSALDNFNSAAKWNPDIDGLDENIAHAYYSLHEYNKSLEYYYLVLKLHPDMVNIRYVIAVISYTAKDYNQVVQVLNPINDYRVMNRKVAYMYADSLMKVGNTKKGQIVLNALNGYTDKSALSIH